MGLACSTSTSRTSPAGPGSTHPTVASTCSSSRRFGEPSPVTTTSAARLHPRPSRWTPCAERCTTAMPTARLPDTAASWSNCRALASRRSESVVRDRGRARRRVRLHLRLGPRRETGDEGTRCSGGTCRWPAPWPTTATPVAGRLIPSRPDRQPNGLAQAVLGWRRRDVAGFDLFVSVAIAAQLKRLPPGDTDDPGHRPAATIDEHSLGPG